MNIHEKYIKRCIELAKNGLGTTSPNPTVGCVIVFENHIIGEGYTSPYGGHHAEVNAINSVKDKKLLKNSILYVSLEPCNHFGKTPPCSDLIIKHKIPKVIVGTVDPYEEVAGKGIKKLKKYGCDVLVGVLENECKEINRRFFTFYSNKRPYIILKWAETKDGLIDIKRKKNYLNKAKPNWISNQYSRQLVHKWRSEEQAILIGTNTALNDNPKLDVRNWTGKKPIRIVLDRTLKIPNNYNLFDQSVKTIIITEKDSKSTCDNLVIENIDFSGDIARKICDLMLKHKIQSLLIEGGAQTLQTFIDANLWDEARIFIGDMSFYEGVKAPNIRGREIISKNIRSDKLIVLKNKN